MVLGDWWLVDEETSGPKKMVHGNNNPAQDSVYLKHMQHLQHDQFSPPTQHLSS
jgi:hypothetical protein